MHNVYLVSVLSSDKTGLVSVISGCLFDLGINLGSTSFTILGSGAKFTAVCESASGVSKADLEEALVSLPELSGAEIQVVDFEFSPKPAANTEITHRITIQGGDHPGLVARLTEVFMEFDANIVRLNAEPISNDGEKQYLIRIAVWMPANREHACLASISNTASSLQMQCSYTRLPGELG
jgi:glycine cleavage system transcriptional repressor